MLNKKNMLRVISVLLVLTMLVACGGKATEPTKEEVKPEQTQEEAREVEKKPRPDTEITLNDEDIKVTSKDVEKNLAKKDVPFVYDEPVRLETFDTILKNQEFYTNNAIGAIHIPNQKIRLAVLHGVNDTIMFAGAGTLSPYQVMGQNNFPLISHKLYLSQDQNLLFNQIENVEMGSIIRLTDLETIWEYKAYDFIKIDEKNVDAVDPFKTGPNGKPIISLVTCVAYGEPSRYVLYGELVNTKPYTEEAFDAAE